MTIHVHKPSGISFVNVIFYRYDSFRVLPIWSLFAFAAIHFAPLPQDSILPFDDTNDICVDFDVPEYIRSKTDVLITHTMKTIYQELQTSTRRFKLVLHGASGVGKTMTLLFVGHMARKSGCLVFPNQAGSFVDQARPLSEIVGRFLRSWRNAVGDQLLSQLPCQISSFRNLLELLKNALSPQSNVISCFLMLVDELQS